MAFKATPGFAQPAVLSLGGCERPAAGPGAQAPSAPVGRPGAGRPETGAAHGPGGRLFGRAAALPAAGRVPARLHRARSLRGCAPERPRVHRPGGAEAGRLRDVTNRPAPDGASAGTARCSTARPAPRARLTALDASFVHPSGEVLGPVLARERLLGLQHTCTCSEVRGNCGRSRRGTRWCGARRWTWAALGATPPAARRPARRTPRRAPAAPPRVPRPLSRPARLAREARSCARASTRARARGWGRLG